MSDIGDLVPLNVQFAVAMPSRIVSVNRLQEPSYHVQYFNLVSLQPLVTPPLLVLDPSQTRVYDRNEMK